MAINLLHLHKPKELRRVIWKKNDLLDGCNSAINLVFIVVLSEEL